MHRGWPRVLLFFHWYPRVCVFDDISYLTYRKFVTVIVTNRFKYLVQIYIVDLLGHVHRCTYIYQLYSNRKEKKGKNIIWPFVDCSQHISRVAGYRRAAASRNVWINRILLNYLLIIVSLHQWPLLIRRCFLCTTQQESTIIHELTVVSRPSILSFTWAHFYKYIRTCIVVS